MVAASAVKSKGKVWMQKDHRTRRPRNQAAAEATQEARYKGKAYKRIERRSINAQKSEASRWPVVIWSGFKSWCHGKKAVDHPPS